LKLTFLSKLREFNVKEGGADPVVKMTVEGPMSESEIGQLAKLVGKTVYGVLRDQQLSLWDDEEPRFPKYCPACGKGLEEMARSCYACGAVQPAVEEPEQPADEQPAGKAEQPPKSKAEVDPQCQRAAAFAIKWKRKAESESGVSPEGTMFACEEHRELMLALASEKAEGGPVAVVDLAAMEDASNRCSYVEESKVDPWPYQTCGKPAEYKATIDDGDGPITKLLCGEHLKEFDRERQAEVETAPKGSVCEFLIHPASQECLAQEAELLEVHIQVTDKVREICGGCPSAELCKGEVCDRLKEALDNLEADAQSEADQHERHMAKAAEEKEFQEAVSTVG
jgi:hypothetical protein